MIRWEKEVHELWWKFMHLVDAAKAQAAMQSKRRKVEEAREVTEETAEESGQGSEQTDDQ